MKKFMRLLALTLAMAMMLSMAAVAADERDSPETTGEPVEDTTPADTPDAAEPETPTGEDAAVTPADPAEPTDPADTPSEGDPGDIVPPEESEEPGEGETEGPWLIAEWLDNMGDGFYLPEEHGWDRELYMSPGDEFVLLFSYMDKDGNQTYVIPESGNGLYAEQLPEEEILPGEELGEYFVRIRLDSWNDIELICDDAVMPIYAVLPWVGLYTSEVRSEETYLRNDSDMDPSVLGDTVYLISDTLGEEDYGRWVTDVQKNPNGASDVYDLEKINDTTWKITILTDLFTHGGASVNLDISYKDRNVDGENEGTEERNWWFNYPEEPQLWVKWIRDVYWNEETESKVIELNDGYDPSLQTLPSEEAWVVFYTSDECDEDYQPIDAKPVLPEDLVVEPSTGIQIVSLADEAPDDPNAPYLVKVTIDDWFKEYKITSGGHVMYADSNLPYLGFYSRPELTPDAYLSDWKYSPTQSQTVYIGSYVPPTENRKFAGLKFTDEFVAEGAEEAFTLEPSDNGFYKLTRKTFNLPETGISFEITWEWPDGRLENWGWGLGTWNAEALVVSDKPLPDNRDNLPHYYEDIKDQVRTSITLEEGETKTIYLGDVFYRDRLNAWLVSMLEPDWYIADGLTLTHDYSAEVPTQYTITCNTPGEYEIAFGYPSWWVYDEDGNEISIDLQENYRVDPHYDWETGKWTLIQWDENYETYVPYDYESLNYTVEFYPAEDIDHDINTIKVTVTKKPDPVTPDTPIIPPYVFADTYRVDLASAFTGGKVVSNVSYAEAGENVTLTVQPDKGYELASLSVTDARGRAVALTEVSANVYRFRMPALRVSVSAVFEKIVEDTTPAPAPAVDPTTAAAAASLVGTPGLSGITLNSAPMPFSDVRSSDWFYNDVDFMWKHYLMSGTSDYAFSPNATTSRAMIWTVLARMNGVRTDQYAGSVWYERGKQWSQERGLTDGTNPMGEVTREQLVTMLWRNAGQPASSAEISQFSDAGTVSGYAQAAVRWAVSTGLLTGSDGKLNPQGTATRAQIAALVSRYAAKAA